MPYVRRDGSGRVVALTAEPETDQDEVLDIGHPDVIAFLRGGPEPAAPVQKLVSLDTDMARVSEDLIEVLVAKGVLRFTDLPPAAQHKLLERRRLRQQSTPVGPVLVEGDELI